MKKMNNLATLFLAGALAFLPVNSSSQVKGNLTTKVKSDCVFSILGSIPGVGPHLQNSVNLSNGNFSSYAWLNTDMGNKMDKGSTYNEFDFGVSYTLSLGDKTSLNICENGFIWDGNSTFCPSADLSYSNKASLNFSWYHLFKDKKLGIPNGDAFIGKVSKEFPLSKNISFTPSFYSIYVNTFFGNNTGNAANVVGGKVSYKKGNATFSGSLNNQWEGNVKNNSSIHDQFFWDLSISTNF